MKDVRTIWLQRLTAVSVGSGLGFITESLLFSLVFLRIGYMAQLRFGGSDPQVDSIYPKIGVLVVYGLSLIPLLIAGGTGSWLIIRKKEIIRGIIWSSTAIGIAVSMLCIDPAYCMSK